MLKYMLDTNICTFTIKNKPHEVREAFNRYHGQICISTVTLVELIYGAETSASPEKNLAVVEGFAARPDVLGYNHDAAAHSGQLRAELEKVASRSAPTTR
ncbi:PIN domain-containing protein [Paraburkholderia sediminicola]